MVKIAPYSNNNKIGSNASANHGGNNVYVSAKEQLSAAAGKDVNHDSNNNNSGGDG